MPFAAARWAFLEIIVHDVEIGVRGKPDAEQAPFLVSEIAPIVKNVVGDFDQRRRIQGFVQGRNPADIVSEKVVVNGYVFVIAIDQHGGSMRRGLRLSFIDMDAVRKGFGDDAVLNSQVVCSATAIEQIDVGVEAPADGAMIDDDVADFILVQIGPDAQRVARIRALAFGVVARPKPHVANDYMIRPHDKTRVLKANSVSRRRLAGDGDIRVLDCDFLVPQIDDSPDAKHHDPRPRRFARLPKGPRTACGQGGDSNRSSASAADGVFSESLRGREGRRIGGYRVGQAGGKRRKQNPARSHIFSLPHRRRKPARLRLGHLSRPKIIRHIERGCRGQRALHKTLMLPAKRYSAGGYGSRRKIGEVQAHWSFFWRTRR
ncbi:MAG: hypothetical protein BWZ10_02204 [candidate division BRC1 bacterium ADurb.BinA364]|nr:MAG: hypothetical protein BWZ10_02204 [candidate division BRC1 bacterium ADurb.BinA364]